MPERGKACQAQVRSSGSGRELADGIADAVTETKQITFDI
jgi:hypothetical protein